MKTPPAGPTHTPTPWMKLEQDKYKRWFIRFNDVIIADGDDAFWSEEEAIDWWNKHSHEVAGIGWKEANE